MNCGHGVKPHDYATKEKWYFLLSPDGIRIFAFPIS